MTVDVWAFEPAHDDMTAYADGTVVPHRAWRVTLNGVVVGEVECHMHRRRGRDRLTDMSFGATFVAYGPPRERGS